MANANLEELVDYPAIAIHAIGDNHGIVSLLTDNPKIVIGSKEADDVYDKYLYDYAYIDSTSAESCAYVCVEAEVSKQPSATMKQMTLYVTVVCHKNFMRIDPDKFPGMIGNRRDNLCLMIDEIIGDSDIFGIGKLNLLSANVVSSPPGFTIRELTYQTPEFRAKGSRA